MKEKLKPLIARPFAIEAEYRAELTPLLTADEMKSYRAIVLKISERTLDMDDRVGGGLEALGPVPIASHGTASVLTQPEFRDGVIDLMSQIQLADGKLSSRRIENIVRHLPPMEISARQRSRYRALTGLPLAAGCTWRRRRSAIVSESV